MSIFQASYSKFPKGKPPLNPPPQRLLLFFVAVVITIVAVTLLAHTHTDNQRKHSHIPHLRTHTHVRQRMHAPCVCATQRGVSASEMGPRRKVQRCKRVREKERASERKRPKRQRRRQQNQRENNNCYTCFGNAAKKGVQMVAVVAHSAFQVSFPPERPSATPRKTQKTECRSAEKRSSS